MTLVAYVSSAAGGIGSGTGGVVCAVPAGNVGDKLIALCSRNNTGASWTGHADWGSPTFAGSGTSSAVFERWATGGEAASYTFTSSVTTNVGDVVIVRLSGVSSLQEASFKAAASVNTIALDQVTAVNANTYLLQVVMKVGTGATTYTPPGTATERADATAGTGSAITYAVGDELVGIGATGTRTWTQSVSTGTLRGFMVAVNPADRVKPYVGNRAAILRASTY